MQADLDRRERFSLLVGVVYVFTAELGIAGLVMALFVVWNTLRRH